MYEPVIINKFGTRSPSTLERNNQTMPGVFVFVKALLGYRIVLFSMILLLSGVSVAQNHKYVGRWESLHRQPSGRLLGIVVTIEQKAKELTGVVEFHDP